MPGFLDYVKEAWSRQVPDFHNHLATLHTKLSRTAKALKVWSRTLTSQAKWASAICREVIERLELAHEIRQLSEGEKSLVKKLKSRLLGLAAIEKCRARQRSRLTWLKKGDANMKFFHLMANARRKNNFIHSLQTDNDVALSQQEKHKVIFNHYMLHTGTYVPRSCSLNLSALGWDPQHLLHLELPFVEEEVRVVIMVAPKEKSPGPDGFIGLFFSICLDMIKDDIIRAVSQFYLANQQGLQFLNQAYVVLIPKKSNPMEIKYYRPISLTHSFAKILSKLLANRLALELEKLISINQTTFIQKRCIHDNFVYVQQVIKDLHKKNTPALFIKLDISKAFDSVNWHFLLDIMTHLSFGQRWRDWMSALW
jgi:hypothetical protein